VAFDTGSLVVNSNGLFCSVVVFFKLRIEMVGDIVSIVKLKELAVASVRSPELFVELAKSRSAGSDSKWFGYC
jgi:hypothetical protein